MYAKAKSSVARADYKPKRARKPKFFVAIMSAPTENKVLIPTASVYLNGQLVINTSVYAAETVANRLLRVLVGAKLVRGRFK